MWYQKPPRAVSLVVKFNIFMGSMPLDPLSIDMHAMHAMTDYTPQVLVHMHMCIDCTCMYKTLHVTSSAHVLQGSDVGFQPMVGQPIPACDTNERVISHLEYHVYRQCVSYDDFGEELLFGALDDMLNPLTSDKVQCKVGCSALRDNFPLGLDSRILAEDGPTLSLHCILNFCAVHA